MCRSYGAQGLFKFGLNEFFKDFYTYQVGHVARTASVAVRSC